MEGESSIDKFTVEFYKSIWNILSEDILEVFNESPSIGSLPLSWRTAVISLEQDIEIGALCLYFVRTTSSSPKPCPSS